MKTFTAYVEWDPVTKLYSATVPAISGAQAQGYSLDELQANIADAMRLCIQSLGEQIETLPTFIGLLQVQIGE